MDIDYKTTITVTASLDFNEFVRLDKLAAEKEQPLFEWLDDTFAGVLCDSIELDRGKLQIIAECDPTTAINFVVALRGLL